MDKIERSEDFTEDEGDLLLSERSIRRPKTRRLPSTVTILLVTIALILPFASYYSGYQVGRSSRPRLPTEGIAYTMSTIDFQYTIKQETAITRDAVTYQLKLLDDEFEVELAENARFKGPPRPELDEAWENLLKPMNIRVSPETARKTNFTSLELGDGSGDSWGTPAVFHNLHCLKTIRQAQFPLQYPEAWEIMKPDKNGGMSMHFDHCLDNLRQAIMCQGDMALYRYFWQDNLTRPRVTMKAPHVCVDWQQLHEWSTDHSFSLNDGVLVHPKFGKVDPTKWGEEERILREAKQRDHMSDG